MGNKDDEQQSDLSEQERQVLHACNELIGAFRMINKGVRTEQMQEAYGNRLERVKLLCEQTGYLDVERGL